MTWKDIIISALRKGDLNSAMKVAVNVDFEEILSLLQYVLKNKENDRSCAALLNELGIFYFDRQQVSEAEGAFHEALKRCRGHTDNPGYTYEIIKALINLGILYCSTGRFDEAEKVYKKALQIEKNSKSVEDPGLAIILMNLGTLYQNTHRFSEAETVYKETLQHLQELIGRIPEMKPDVALTLMNLGLVYWNTKQFTEAEKAYREAIEIYEGLNSKNHIVILHFATTLNNLGILYQNTQRFSEAEKVHKKALNMYQELDKNVDVRVGISDTFLNLGNLYWTTKQFLKAEENFKESLKMKRELAAKNPEGFALDVVLALTNLGNLYRDTGDLLKAENFYTDALTKCRNLAEKGPEGYMFYVALILNNLGMFYHDSKMADEAEKAYYEALEIRRDLAKKNPGYAADVAMTLNNLGLFYRNTARYSEAKNVYNEALHIYYNLEEKTSAFVPDIARTLNNLGILYSDAQEFSEAENVYQKALELYGTLEENSAYVLDIAGTLKNMGNLYRDAKRFDKAEKAYTKALTILTPLEKDNPDAYQVHVASLLNDLGILYQDTRKFYEAETAHREALKRREDLFKKNPQAYAVDLAGTLNNLGILYNDAHLYGKERFSEAETVYKEALKTFEHFKEEYPEVFTPHVAGMLNNLGALYKDTQRFSEAEEIHRMALRMRQDLARETPDVFAREVADSLNSLAILYESAGRKREAEKYYRNAFEKYKELGLWVNAANTVYYLSQVTSDRNALEYSRRLMELAVLFSGEEKYKYVQKGMNEAIYWRLLEHDTTSFSVLETLRDPELLSLSWEYIVSQEKLDEAQKNVDVQRNMVDELLTEYIPSITILETFPKNSGFVYVQVLQDYILFYVVENDGIQRFECGKEFLEIGYKLLYNLQIQRGAAGKVNDLTAVTEIFEKYCRKWSEVLPDGVHQLFQEKDCIVLSPDMYCSYLPLEALLLDGQPLCIEKTVVRAASLHQFVTLFKRRPSFDSSLIVGNPWIGCGEEKLVYSLPSGSEKFEISFLGGAEDEARAIEQLLLKRNSVKRLSSPTMILREDATGEKFLSEISQHSLIHFCGHGSLGRILFFSGPFKGFPPPFEPEEFSDLRKAERIEGKKINMMEEWHPVTDLDLFDVPLTEGAVIFLNACETGKHKYAGGGYYQGLPAVFLRNGAHSVVSSLVPVFDNSSKKFAIKFYENLLHTHSVSQSLKEARIWAKDKYKAQIYWLPYIHYGPPV